MSGGAPQKKRKAEIGVSAFKEGEAGITIAPRLLRTREEAVTAPSRLSFGARSGVGYSPLK
jgi:hypothetical protein